MAFVLHYGYTGLVKQYGEMSKFGLIPWSLPAALSTNLASDVIIRIFFSRKIWFLSGQNLAVVSVIGVVVSISFALSFCNYKTSGTLGLKQKEWIMICRLVMTTVTDLSIAAALCFYFAKSRKTYYEGTRSVISSLLHYTVQTGLFATLWSVGSLITVGAKPNSGLGTAFYIFYLPLSKIYVNALLASLNARESLREKSRVLKSSPLEVYDENGMNLIALNTCAQAHRAAGAVRATSTTVTTSGSGRISVDEDDDKVIAIQVQVDREITEDSSPYESDVSSRFNGQR
ncbi:hypothetical protein SCHPADRAFT_59338 [Schizopora paradoxa]|uniref:DUF6534 domain-containing protein n=1 Tax=Schizopora paradoxa TaxID=27342 RepID=A0A0H2SD97_9AGAM|nr:hypothetical protein SCHPADRAFT_59338 [Schizopora paradoxa]